MIRYECDKCGAGLTANDCRRFIVKFEIYAAAGPAELPAGGSDAGEELNRVLEALAVANPDEVEDQTYRCFRFDVCDACRRILMANPLG